MKIFHWFGCFMLMASLLSTFLTTEAQKRTVVFATRDTQQLRMDIYPSEKNQEKNPCIVFVFGGGFLMGERDAKTYSSYFKFLSENGFTVASIDYRLGLKGAAKVPSLFNRKPLINAINMAVEDFYSATDYLLKHAGELHLDTSQIIASGSSAGAITVLTGDYRKRNGYDKGALPPHFQYAGIISFAGAVYSNHGHPKYAIHPAPMLLFQGNKDKVVPFKKISLFGTGMYGSSVINKRFKKIGAPYQLVVFEQTGHAAAEFPMHDYLSTIETFLNLFVVEKKPLYIKTEILDRGRKDKEFDFKKAFPKK